MNPITVSLLVVIAVFCASASLVLALAIARAQDGYEDETGFHRGSPRRYARPALVRVRTAHPRGSARTKRTREAEPLSVG